MKKFLSELRRRRVFRVAAAYALVAWVIIEVVETIFPILMLPDWLVRAVAVLTLLGFPVALALAWAFDITPEGVRRTEGGTPRSNRRGPAYVGLGALFALIGVGAYAYLIPSPSPNPTPNASPSFSSSSSSNGSIAVLPFVNMSSDPEQEYFSDGLTEELLNALAQIPDLRVAARTSSFAFKNVRAPVDSIGRVLRVAQVLEGSVRKAGDRVRITAQLIRSDSGYHLWSETYDRDLSDIFAVQEEIAQAIVDALEFELGSDDRVAIAATPSLEAYDAYLRALAFEYTNREENEAAISLLGEAIRLDPAFAAAHADLAFRFTNRVEVHGFPREWADSGIATARHAVVLDSLLPDAHYALGTGLAVRGRLREGIRAITRAIELSPSYGEAMNGVAVWSAALGRHDEAIRWALRGIELSPQSPWLYNALGFISTDLGNLDSADHYLRQALAVDPDFSWAFTNLADLELARGDAEAARGWIDRLLARDPNHVIGLWRAGTIAATTGDWVEAIRSYGQAYRLAPETRGSTSAVSLRVHFAQALLRTGERQRAEALLDTARVRTLDEINAGSESPGIRLELAAISGLRGDLDDADHWMQAAYDAGLRWIWIDQVPLLEPLRQDPGFRSLIERIRQDCAAMRARLQDDPGG